MAVQSLTACSGKYHQGADNEGGTGAEVNKQVQILYAVYQYFCRYLYYCVLVSFCISICVFVFVFLLVAVSSRCV